MINQASGPGGRSVQAVGGSDGKLTGTSHEEYKTLASMNEEEKVTIKAGIQQRHPNY